VTILGVCRRPRRLFTPALCRRGKAVWFLYAAWPHLIRETPRTVDRRAATDRDAAMLDLVFLALGAALFLAALAYARACANI